MPETVADVNSKTYRELMEFRTSASSSPDLENTSDNLSVFLAAYPQVFERLDGLRAKLYLHPRREELGKQCCCGWEKGYKLKPPKLQGNIKDWHRNVLNT
jgi:hypothetical protein